MAALKRKRVTRVGSGAYSVYLPKRWIDSWSPEQQKEREVDLHLINQSLLIVPAQQEDHLRLKAAPQQDSVRALLLSAYVRGHRQVTLTPAQGRFDEDCVAHARDFLRKLDERLRSSVGPERIQFTLQRELPAPFTSGHDLLQLMASKLQEMLELAGECAETFATQPERALHAARLLAAIHDEDLARLLAQAIRLVATLELPLGRISEFQLLDLAAAEMHAASAEALGVARAALSAYGLSLRDLAYPRAELAERARPLAPLPPSGLEGLRACRAAIRDAQSLLRRLTPAFQAGDVELLLFLAGDAAKAQEAFEQATQAALAHPAGDPETWRAALQAHAVGNPVRGILSALARLADRTLALASAQEPPPAPA